MLHRYVNNTVFLLFHASSVNLKYVEVHIHDNDFLSITLLIDLLENYVILIKQHLECNLLIDTKPMLQHLQR